MHSTQTIDPVSIPTASDLQRGQSSYRIESIDLLRGLIMIIMALDHIRDYFHADAMLYNPTDLSQTNVLLFFTRFITHYCAPVFMFLSGTSACLVGIRKGRKALSKFLFTRGLWLVFLELTVVSFAWFFDIHFITIGMFVIWALGISMIALSILIYLPQTAILFIGLLMVFGHNLLDNVHVPGSGFPSFIWSVIHEQQDFEYKGHFFFVGYPVVPWIGVMALGYCAGGFYKNDFDAARRKRLLLLIGIGSIVLFILLRYSNWYGDASHWSQQSQPAFTVLSFLNVSKYPPSLLYLLVTLGPALIFLSFTERSSNWLAEKIKIIGRVPMFYYLVHLYLIHLGAMLAASLSGFSWKDMILTNWISSEPQLRGYGFSLGVVYAIWFLLIIILYFLCKWYDGYKKRHKEKWWLSYL
ncbi:MAG: heparan-alpha-glucosaminide N-acetyltransferase domain-containing protein [Bacteroidota bacterium]